MLTQIILPFDLTLSAVSKTLNSTLSWLDLVNWPLLVTELDFSAARYTGLMPEPEGRRFGLQARFTISTYSAFRRLQSRQIRLISTYQLRFLFHLRIFLLSQSKHIKLFSICRIERRIIIAVSFTFKQIGFNTIVSHGWVLRLHRQWPVHRQSVFALSTLRHLCHYTFKICSK